MNNVIIEEKQFDYLSNEMQRPYATIRRFSNNGDRFYFEVPTTPTEDIILYSSGTRLISDGYAEDTTFLEKWRNALKSEGKNPKEELDYLASRGTLMHCLLGDYITSKDIDLGDLHQHFMSNHPECLNLPYYNKVIGRDTEWLVKAVLAFGAFVKEFNVKPMAVELMMASKQYMVASPIDMICEMTIEEKGFFGEVYKTGVNAGKPKESKQSKVVTAIVDFKSSVNGFQDKHFFQLQLNKIIFEENYPEKTIDNLFNWSPKEWTSSPTFNLKDQTEGPLLDLCECVFTQGKLKHLKKDPTIKSYSNKVNISDFSVENVYNKVTVKSFLKEKYGSTNN